MKILQKQSRPLNVKETKTLQKIRSTANNILKRGYISHNFLIALILGVVFAWLATWTKYDILVFIFGTGAVFSFAYIVFMPYDIYKDLKKTKLKVNQINQILAANTIDVYPMIAKRVAFAKEYEDEGDLFIIETHDKKILYLWDSDHNLRKNFPCHEFEIYDKDFGELIGRLLNPLSEKFKPIVIDTKTKWNYLAKAGGPEHMAMEKKNFDKLIEQINKHAG